MKSFKITGYGNTGGDQCRAYFIDVSQDSTVGDVIKDILSAKSEWGDIVVELWKLNCKTEYKIEYKHGEILPMSEYDRGKWHILQQFTVHSVRGYGGWSCSTYWIKVEIK